MTAPTGLVVNPNTAVVHRRDCKHARRFYMPWEGFAVTPSDKPCGFCRPDLGERP